MLLNCGVESPLDCKEIHPVHPEGNQSWIFIGRTDAEALILWPPDSRSQLIGKDPDARQDQRQEEKGTTENEMVGWLHQLNGHEFKQTPRDGEEQGILACCSPWGHKALDTTEWLNTSTLQQLWTTFSSLICRGLWCFKTSADVVLFCLERSSSASASSRGLCYVLSELRNHFFPKAFPDPLL